MTITFFSSVNCEVTQNFRDVRSAASRSSIWNRVGGGRQPLPCFSAARRSFPTTEHSPRGHALLRKNWGVGWEFCQTFSNCFLVVSLLASFLPNFANPPPNRSRRRQVAALKALPEGPSRRPSAARGDVRS